jgi:hypothetical protein
MAAYLAALASMLDRRCSSLGPASSWKTLRFASLRDSAASRLIKPGDGRSKGSLDYEVSGGQARSHYDDTPISSLDSSPAL